jgi:RNA polymerase sigma factor (sigma-70 family)
MKIEVINKTQESFLRLLSELSSREIIILNLRYGQRKTQDGVAVILNITNERVRQLEDRALKTIKEYL